MWYLIYVVCTKGKRSFTSKPETGFSQEPHRGCGMWERLERGWNPVKVFGGSRCKLANCSISREQVELLLLLESTYFPSVGSSKRSEHFLGSRCILCRTESQLMAILWSSQEHHVKSWWNSNGKSEYRPLKTQDWGKCIVEGVWETVCETP